MLPQFFPLTDLKLSIGGPNGLLLLGSSFDRVYDWLGFVDCAEDPVDFTGFTIIAEILDSTKAVLDTFTVTPSAGDTTGIFALHLDDTQVDANLQANATHWQLRITDGTPAVNHLLIFTSFKVT